jgi:hypothetical protein
MKKTNANIQEHIPQYVSANTPRWILCLCNATLSPKDTADQNFIPSTCSSILSHIMTIIQLVRKLSTFNRIRVSTLPHTKECHNTPTHVPTISQHSQLTSIISLIQTLLCLVMQVVSSPVAFCQILMAIHTSPYIQHTSSILSYSLDCTNISW